MANLTQLGSRFGTNNVMVPKGGPATVPAVLDFTNSSEVEVDGELVVTTGKIEYLQGVFIDNSDNAAAISLTMNTTGQRIVCPPNAQGYFAIMAPNPPKILVNTPQSANKRIPVFFYNVPIQSAVWKTT